MEMSNTDAFLDMCRILVADAGCEWDGLQIPFGNLDELNQYHATIHFRHNPTRRHLEVPVNLLLDKKDWIAKQIQKVIGPQEKKMTDTPKLNLRQKLVQIYNELDHVEKAGRNAKQNYNFVRAADVMRPIRDMFAKYGIYAETNFDYIGSYDIKTNSGGNMHTATVKAIITLFDADSDEFKTISGLGDGADGGDKGIYKAQTGAVKNALRNGTLLPDEGDPNGGDPEADQNVDERTSGNYAHPASTTELPDFQEAQHAAPKPNPAPKAKPPVEARPTAAAAPKATAAYAPAADGPNQPAQSTATPASSGATAAAAQSPTETAKVAAPEHGDAWEAPEADCPPTEAEWVEYRAKFKLLGDDLTAHGKLKPSAKMPVNRKLLVFLLSITKAPDAKQISKNQWDDFFKRVDAATANPEVGLVGLAKLVNKANGIEK
jgi:hypothetical protein